MKGEGMKTFINALRVAVVTVLFVSLSSLGFIGGCCKKESSCAPKASCAPGCKLQPEPVKIRKTCDKPGFYKQVCHLEYIPCEGTVEEREERPIFIGCYDEQGNRIDGNGQAVDGNWNHNNHHVAYTQDVTAQVEVPASYEQKAQVRNNNQRTNGRNMRRGTRVNNANTMNNNMEMAQDVK
jgi:hypothetical protein